MLVEVAVGAPVRGSFTYEVADDQALTPGQRLIVPFGRRKALGFYLGPAREVPSGELRRVEEVLDGRSLFSDDLLALIRFAADYYLYPLGEALRGALPPGLARPRPAATTERAPRVETVTLIEPLEVARAALGRSPRQAALVEHLAARGGSASLAELKVAIPGAPALARRLEARGLVELGVEAPPVPDPTFAQAAPTPSPQQLEVGAEIEAALERFQPFLLHGVTGSGKTEVYLRAIERVREGGGGALVLVPEIALTPQLAGRFRSRFGDEVAVLHSGLSDRERTQEHRRLLEGEAKIALGVRSTVFAPVPDLGIVIVDEEHEPSFKQEEKLRYHARDLAIYRARLVGVPCVLGSATPSLESLQNAREGRYRLLRLPERIDARPLPAVEIVDLARARSARRRAATEARALAAGGEDAAGGGDEGLAGTAAAGTAGGAAGGELDFIGPELAGALEETLREGRQAILFLNRRGHASLVVCASCGESARCPNCDVTLTHHLSRDELRCHYCDLRRPKPPSCPSCYGELLVLGLGTERIEKELARRFPEARSLRLDRDAITSSAALTRVLASFARGEADILIGTQMVAKGHDFPGVTLVGVILADVGLGLPDFRAAERTFQLLTQVAGRAGRGEDPGRVVIQSFNPEAEAIACVRAHDYERFSAAELERRRELGYPPYRRALAIRFEGIDPAAVERVAEQLGRAARRWQARGMSVLGPAPAPIARLRGKSRYQLLILAQGPGPIQALGRRLRELAEEAPKSVKVSFDVDPASML